MRSGVVHDTIRVTRSSVVHDALVCPTFRDLRLEGCDLDPAWTAWRHTVEHAAIRQAEHIGMGHNEHAFSEFQELVHPSVSVA